jgi:hypothetical protein
MVQLRVFCSTRVATELGSKSPQRAKQAAWVGLSLALGLGLFTCTALLLVHTWWPILFIDPTDQKLWELSSALMIFGSLATIGDAVQNNAGGEATVANLKLLGNCCHCLCPEKLLDAPGRQFLSTHCAMTSIPESYELRQISALIAAATRPWKTLFVRRM